MTCNTFSCSSLLESKADGVASSHAALPCVGEEAETVSEQQLDAAGEIKTANSDNEQSDSSDSEEEEEKEVEKKTEQEVRRDEHLKHM